MADSDRVAVKLRSSRVQWPGGSQKPGDTIRVSAAEAERLVAKGRAEYAEGTRPRPSRKQVETATVAGTTENTSTKRPVRSRSTKTGSRKKASPKKKAAPKK